MNLAFYCLLFTAVGVGFIFVHLVAGKLIRPNKPGPEKKTIYECGEPTIGSAWIQFDLRFYVVALLFVIFDVEVAFFFPWAEIFGRANDVAALTPPATAAAYPEFSRKVLALAPAPTRRPALRKAYEMLAAANDSRQFAFLDAAMQVDRYLQAVARDRPDERKTLPTPKDEGNGLAIGYRDAAAKLLALPSLPDAKGVDISAVRSAIERLAHTDDPKQFEEILNARVLVGQDLGLTDGNPIQQANSLAWMAFFDILVFFGVLLVGYAYLWRRGDLAWVRSTAAERVAPEPPPPPPTPVPPPAKAPEPALSAPVGAH